MGLWAGGDPGLRDNLPPHTHKPSSSLLQVAQASSRLDEATFPEDTESEITHWLRKGYDSTFDDEDLMAGGPSGGEPGSGGARRASEKPLQRPPLWPSCPPPLISWLLQMRTAAERMAAGSSQSSPPRISSPQVSERVPGWRSEKSPEGGLVRPEGCPRGPTKCLPSSSGQGGPLAKASGPGRDPLAPAPEFLGAMLAAFGAAEDARSGRARLRIFPGAEAKLPPRARISGSTRQRTEQAHHPGAWMGKAAGRICLDGGLWGRCCPVLGAF